MYLLLLTDYNCFILYAIGVTVHICYIIIITVLHYYCKQWCPVKMAPVKITQVKMKQVKVAQQKWYKWQSR